MDEHQKAILERHKIARGTQHLFELLHQFTNIKRYSHTHLIKPENDMEHTGFVVMFCFIVALKMKDKGYTLDIGVLLSKAAIHDFEEAMTGDIIRTTKHANSEIQHAVKGVEARAITQIQKFLGVDFHETWQTSKSIDLEGELVGLADTAAVVYKCMTEISIFGNRGMNRVLEEITTVLRKMKWSMEGYQQETGQEAPFDWLILELYDIAKRIGQGNMNHNAFWAMVGETPYG